MQGSSHLLRIVTVLVVCCGLTSGQSNYVDDFELENLPAPVPQRPRPGGAGGYSRPTSSAAAAGPRPTPVPILKQIDRHNDDGSYTYGYEGADGSFKIETKLVSGEVMGKYGYVDDTGKVRVVEYGANRYGFQPAGEGITVAPPTLVDETTDKKGNKIQQEYPDDGSYFAPQEEAPQVRAASRPRPPVATPRPAPPPPRPQPRPQPVSLGDFDDFPPFGPSGGSHRSAGQLGSSGPVPPRAAIPGAAPVQSFRPAPAPVYESSSRSLGSRPQPSNSRPLFDGFPSAAPVAAPRPPPPPAPAAPRPQPSRASYARSSGGILDQLEKDYALPAGVATHDISFGLY